MRLYNAMPVQRTEVRVAADANRDVGRLTLWISRQTPRLPDLNDEVSAIDRRDSCKLEVIDPCAPREGLCFNGDPSASPHPRLRESSAVR